MSETIQPENEIWNWSFSYRRFVQAVYDQTTGYRKYSGNISYDGSKPTNNEGTQILGVGIAPRYSDSLLVVDALVYGGEAENQGDHLTVALFLGSQVDAISAASNYFGQHEAQYGGIRPVPLRFVMRAGGGTKYFSLRVGMDKGVTEINGGGNNQDLGGLISSSLSVSEYYHS